MKVADFDFALPADRIAVRPAVPREAARLLRVTADGLADFTVGDLPALLRRGDLLVLNDTKVIPARLEGLIGAGRVELNLIRAVDGRTWDCLARPGKRFRPGAVVRFGDRLAATVRAKDPEGTITLEFDRAGADLMAALDAVGTMPLPPYIARKRTPDAQDRADYQPVFAAREGAVAAPTASLHLTPDLLARLEAMGVERTMVTLHVGAGTFLPVKVEDTRDHRMHAEWGEVTAAAAEAIGRARREGRRVIAVGTTALRLIESAAAPDGTLSPYAGWTDIFITPGYRFRAVDVLMTNFHLPKSTLFMLVSALAGTERMKAAYAHAVEAGYRFYSYGDASLIDRLEVPA
ncbi:tRNA preQ1(34) S-adenosylmethionine ribosyltransferase-isomerase QueA [Zavarzinia compransoris]|uniref:S-adenosylmethionine:tRNA ribosyltransferase-isomerase n=1 Tax=Zavarzinia compransoris TaxID=1264899 RepID=A0A317DZ74_9PROT|nr:tRNA preQ1(34) S-adenosylmethionine ribosyltransferase-isomerase QueA [Zavarzinia compransoris]PWR20088.1 tRNA preQ1(34) S-adenosylmethionine ribosyltransferase-isomerase QueA [Zavarzinia compransoris]TDP44788.1 S-adenosylmethionine:tRNA ribosyltransferase-isomerase [Zavarzinia compransoris]